jgi:hypothetical protein
LTKNPLPTINLGVILSFSTRPIATLEDLTGVSFFSSMGPIAAHSLFLGLKAVSHIDALLDFHKQMMLVRGRFVHLLLSLKKLDLNST